MKWTNTLRNAGLISAALLCCAWAAAQSMPYRVMETTGATGIPEYPAYTPPLLGTNSILGPAGSVCLFVGTDKANLKALWRMDGTADGTRLVRDIVPTSSLGAAYPDWELDEFIVTHHFAKGPIRYFRKQIDPVCGTWFRSDGTTEGTFPVDNLNLGLDINAMLWSVPYVEEEDYLAFLTRDASGKTQAWYTDFTPDGTRQLSTDPATGTIDEGFGLQRAGAFFYFMAKDTSGRNWVWKSGLRTADTVRLAQAPGESPKWGGARAAAAGDTLYFAGYDTVHGRELWKTDGTVAGTCLVKDIVPGIGDGVNAFEYQSGAPGNGVMYFSTGDYVTRWQTDGTAAGTKQSDCFPAVIHTPSVAGSCKLFLYLGKTAFFRVEYAVSEADNGLWRTDGTREGTRQLLSAPPGTQFSADSLNGKNHVVHTLGGAKGGKTSFSTAFYYCDSENNVWRAEDAVLEPTMVLSLGPGSVAFQQDAKGEFVYFTINGQLWKTNFTPGGTAMVKAIAGVTPPFAEPEGYALFYANFALWRTDGTPEGTVPALDQPTQSAAAIPPDPHILGAVNGRAIVYANDTPESGELWSTDGTSQGTTLLKDMKVVYRFEYEPDLKLTAVMGGNLYFVGRDSLWRTDGTAEGTVEIKPPTPVSFFVYGMAAMGNTLYFTVPSGLWKTDGTATGTVKVSDKGGSHLAVAGSTVYYWGANVALWRSDGTAGGTRRVAEYFDSNMACNPGPIPCQSLDFISPLGSKVFFTYSYQDGRYHTSLRSFDPYFCAGPNAVPANPRNTGVSGWFNPAALPVSGESGYLPLWDEAHGVELWKSDGTAAGTVLVKDISPGKGPSLTSGMVYGLDGAQMYFAAADAEHGVELWKTDGTANGTVLVKDIHSHRVPDRGGDCPDPAGSLPHDMTVDSGAVYFAAADDSTGTEVWMSRGTEASTVRLSDLNPGPGSANPAQFTLAGDRLVFSATDGTDRGRELWAIRLPAKSPANPGAVVLGPNAILWTWNDISQDETGFNVWSNAGAVTPTTLRATLPANATSWRQNGFTANMQYSFRVASTGEFGDSQPSNTVTAWTLVDRLTGLQFLQVGMDSMRVTVSPVPANLKQGQSGLFVENQTRGMDSGWVQTASGWNCTGLSPNQPYTFVGRARNGAAVETVPVVTTKYTMAAPPQAPTVDNPGVHTLELSGIGGTGNPSHTLYAVQMSPAAGGNAWVQADGSLGGEACFQTAGAWAPVTVSGLAEGATYAFSAIARNGEGVDSAPGPAGVGTTLDVTPPTAVITLLDPNPLNAPAVRFGVTFNEPVTPTFAPSVLTPTGTLAGTMTITGTDPVYIVTIVLANPAQDGTVGVAINSSVTDRSGNAYPGGASALYTLTHWAGFTRQPQGARTYTGESHLLEVGVNTGGLPATYQWKHLNGNWTVINGPTTPQWQLPATVPADAGDYWCEVTNGGVPHPSLKVTLSVADHLRITRQPAGGDAFYGDTWAFSVEADGGYPPVHYQWRKGQQNDCPGATEPVYVIDPLEPGDEGLYSVEIHDSHTDMLESYPVRLALAVRVPAAGGAALAVMAGLLALAGVGRSRKRRA